MVGTRTLCPPCGLSTSLRAKRSNPFHSGARRKLDCFVASAFTRRRASADKSAPRNDVITFRIQISNSRCASAFSRRHVARVLRECCPSKEEGAGNAGCALHPRSRVQKRKRKRTRAYRAAENIRHSLRNGFTAYTALSPENRALLSPSSADSWLIRARSGRLAFRRLDANR